MKQRGFTLLEMIVVIVIISILAATLLPTVADMQAEARQAYGKQACGVLQTQALLFYASNKAASPSATIVAAITADGGAFSATGGCTRTFTPTNGVAVACPAISTTFCTP